jgi:NAD(P)-dependent dehydrogenase (short-subunit alcohol dehydrogenase family)
MMNIVVTGSSSGIGRAIVQRLISSENRVWGMARSDQSDFEAAHPKLFRSLRCDVADWTAVASAADSVGKACTGIDALICCAGIQGEVGPTLKANPERWSATVRANLDGTFHSIRAFHGLLARGERRAKIVCFSGGGATKARPNFSAYGAAKTAIVRLVETIAEEAQGSPLDINAVAPGAINTRLTDEVIALGPEVAGRAEFEAAVKQKSTGGASISRALDMVEWLLSEKSDGVTGKLLSAPWDPWEHLGEHVAKLSGVDVFTLRRITPEDRGLKF